MGFDPGTWKYADWGAAGYGAVDIAKAKKRGASTYQLWQLADRAVKEGVEIGPKAAGLMGTRPKAPIDYGAKGGWGFGVDDIDAMGAHKKVDLTKVRAARDWANKHGLSIGGGVNDRIRHIDHIQTQIKNDERLQGIEDEYTKKQTENETRLQGIEDQAKADQKTQIGLIDDWGKKMVKDNKASQDEWIAIQEEAAKQAARVKGNNPTGVGSPASIKGSRLAITQPGGRRGTKRFARPTQYMNTLSTGTGSKSAVNLCDMRAKHEVALLKYTEVNDALATLAFAVQDIREHCNDS